MMITKMHNKVTHSILDLPVELVVGVLRYLPIDNYATLCLTHSYFTGILRSDYLWRAGVLQSLWKGSSFECGKVLQRTPSSHTDYVLVDASTRPLLSSPQPYPSYRKLYHRVLKNYGWMIGTFAGNAQWTGSLIEIFYNGYTGLIECRRLQPSAVFSSAMTYSIDDEVYWRDFDPVIQCRQEPLFEVGHSRPDDEFLAVVARTIGITDEQTINALGSEEIWPSINVPAKERIIVQQIDALSKLGNGFDEFSNNLLVLSRPLLSRAMYELRGGLVSQQKIPRHNELFYRLPQHLPSPAGFEEHSGLFMGDYSSHGPELLYLYYPTPTSLHAVKITGDPNVPRGEISWVIDDLTSPVRICTEREWPGARAYKGRGQISNHGFRSPTWIETEVILYLARSQVVPHTLQSQMTASEVDEYERMVIQDTVEQRRDSTEVEFRSIHQPDSGTSESSPLYAHFDQQYEKAGIVLWWKDMVHLSQFHKINSISSTVVHPTHPF